MQANDTEAEYAENATNLEKQSNTLSSKRAQSYNPNLHAVVSIRSLVREIESNWAVIEREGAEMDAVIKEARALIKTEKFRDWTYWEKNLFIEIKALQEILCQVRSKIKRRDTVSMAAVWQQYRQHSDSARDILEVMEGSETHFTSPSDLESWRSLWEGWRQRFDRILEQAEACRLHLLMIESLVPKEMDEMTHLILKHIPKRFDHVEASAYEAEYLQAYEELKREAARKPTLWDRFLDILAGGMQPETPAQRVLMTRWINGERGILGLNEQD